MKNYEIDGRIVEIYDGEYSADDIGIILNFILDSHFVVKRLSENYTKHLPTLTSKYTYRDFLNSGIFNDFFKNLLKERKLRLVRSYIGLATAGDLYDFHTDDGSYTGLYYANADWNVNWGGETHFGNQSMDDIVFSATFKPGRFVFFDAKIPHKTSIPAPGADNYRYVYVFKFIEESRDLRKNKYYDDCIELLDFCFDTGFDSYSEKETKAISFLKSKINGVEWGHKQFFDHLWNVYSRLRTWGCSEDVCLAGLYHSVYGTETFIYNTPFTKEEVIEHIGEYAESLVDIFCGDNRAEKIFEGDSKELVQLLYANNIDVVREGGHDYESPETQICVRCKLQLRDKYND